jgi:hypothetical protein
LNSEGSPKAERERDRPKTMPYEDLIKQWER